MTFRSLLGLALTGAALFAGVGTQGCSSTTSASDTGVHCTPGAYVFCRCADKGEGTKLCRPDGVSFEACATGAAGECVGGEDITDPQTGEPVDPPDDKDSGTVTPTAKVDACPGQPTAVSSTALVTEGDTTGAADKAKGKPGACTAGGGGPDHIYHLQPTATGALAIKVQGLGTLNPTVYLRSSCEDEASQLSCAETTGPGGAEQLRYEVVTGRDYYLFVDGASGSAGKYAVDLKLTPGPVCGDMKIDTGEACDDGNKVDGDGCSPGCNAVNGDPASGGSCPGQAVHVWPGRSVSGTGSTVGYVNTFTKTGSSCTVSASDLNTSFDHVYAVTAHGAGTLKVTLTPESAFNAMLVARRTCADAATQGTDMCANAGSNGAVETMSFPVTSGQTVYVAADGVLGQKGTYSIKFEL
ncbi:MAG: Multiple EGF-like-domain protein 3 precursor [Labilithrix sp.]|nr:Multiple EGF-like-domain protein 3 precursor [Labilithrix sp.]